MFSATDPRGIRRVFGADSNIAVAEQRCIDTALAYVQREPSSGRIELWTGYPRADALSAGAGSQSVALNAGADHRQVMLGRRDTER
jgi:hypothetical protein